jgi:hypothetical protein
MFDKYDIDAFMKKQSIGELVDRIRKLTLKYKEPIMIEPHTLDGYSSIEKQRVAILVDIGNAMLLYITKNDKTNVDFPIFTRGDEDDDPNDDTDDSDDDDMAGYDTSGEESYDPNDDTINDLTNTLDDLIEYFKSFEDGTDDAHFDFEYKSTILQIGCEIWKEIKNV